MSMNQVPKFIHGRVSSVNFLSKTAENLSGFVTEKLHQDIFFIFEIKINRTIGDPGFLCNLRNR
jgi:hypothetical protein